LPAFSKNATRKLRDILLGPAPFSGPRAVEDLTALRLCRDGVELVRVKRLPGEPPRVTACEFRPAGDVSNLRAVLMRLATDYDLKRARCTLALEPGEYTIVTTDAPAVPKEELRAAVRWRIKDLLDFPVDEATLDVFDAPGGAAGQAAQPVYVVAARNGAIRRVAELCNDTGINLDVIDIPELAQRNLAALCPEDQLGLALIVFEPDHGLITISRNGELYLSRRIDFGMDALSRSEDATRYFEPITLEVQRSLDYFDSHFRAAPTTHLAIVLPVAVPGLVEALAANLNLRVSELRPAERLACDAAFASLLEQRCAVTLGAALREEEAA
jgi:MSHA biogenesis protein MshI